MISNTKKNNKKEQKKKKQEKEKKQRGRKNLKKIYSNPELAKFSPRELIAELKARGYTGELKYTQTISL